MSDRICSVPDCGTGPVVGWGHCNKHYRRLRRTGRLDRPRLEERFFAHVTEGPGGCWIFDRVNTKGYAAFNVDSVPVEGHRWCYIFLIGDVPDGLTLDHRCHNEAPGCPGGHGCPHRACVNPWHLDPVPHRVNILRGVGPAAVNAKRTQCVNGHPFTRANTYVTPNGRRQCRACRAIRTDAFRLRS